MENIRITGVVLVYSFLFGVGKLLFGETVLGSSLIVVGILAGFSINYLLTKLKIVLTK